MLVTLSAPTNATIGTGTITNDDAQPSVTLSLTGSPFSEDGGVATVTATLSNPSAFPVTVVLAFSGTTGAATSAKVRSTSRCSNPLSSLRRPRSAAHRTTSTPGTCVRTWYGPMASRAVNSG